MCVLLIIQGVWPNCDFKAQLGRSIVWIWLYTCLYEKIENGESGKMENRETPKESQKGTKGNQKGANGSQKGNQNETKREARGAQMRAPRFVWQIENIESGKMDNREKQNDQRSDFIYMSAAKIRIPSAGEKALKL